MSGQNEVVVMMGSEPGPRSASGAGEADGALGGGSARRLGDLGEADLLARILPRLVGPPPTVGDQGAAGVLLGAGDDAAVVAAPSGSVVVTTDTMVRGRDWRDDWSGGRDVGAKVVAQNLADIAAMGAVPTGLLVALVADPETALSWVLDLTDGIAAAAQRAGVPVVGGDLSGAPGGVVVIAVTAFGDLAGRTAVLRSGARPGDVIAVAGSLGLSGTGLAVLLRDGPAGEPGWRDVETEAVAYHRAPRPPYGAGPAAARAGATAMIDISDGLLRDAGRVALASGVRVELSGRVLRESYAGPLAAAVGPDEAWRQVLGGGEEHSLLACFPAGTLPEDGSWRAIGRVLPAAPGEAGVTVDGERLPPGGWDHFAG